MLKEKQLLIKQKETNFWITVGHKVTFTFKLVQESKTKLTAKSCGMDVYKETSSNDNIIRSEKGDFKLFKSLRNWYGELMLNREPTVKGLSKLERNLGNLNKVMKCS